jgi:hypothetical protein
MDKHAIYRHQGLGGTSGIGRRCGLVLVDFVNGFVDFDQLGGPHIEAASWLKGDKAFWILSDFSGQNNFLLVST